MTYLKTKFLSCAASAAAFTATMMIAAPSASAAEFSALEITNFIGRIEVQTGPNFALEITQEARTKNISYEDTGRSLSIDGNVRRPSSKGCKGYYGNLSWSTDTSETRKQFGGYKNLEDYPQLTITAPESLVLNISNSIIFGSAGNVAAVNLSDSHCSRFDIGNVTDFLVMDIGGSGAFDIGDAGRADINVSGAAQAGVKSSGATALYTSGSSDAEIGQINGNVTLGASGSSDIEIGNVAGTVDVNTSGSSDVRIDSVSGPLKVGSSGSSSVQIEDGRALTAVMRASGSADIAFDGTAQSADLSAGGASSISIDRVTGDVQTRTSGSADIDVN